MVVLAVAAVSLTGCPGEDTGTPDGGTDGGTQGLTLRWRAVPGVPSGEDNPNVTRATFRIRSLKIIGDAAPGDAATSRENLELEWRSGKAPTPLLFDQAPPGKYAKIDLIFRGDGKDTYELSGMARRNGTDYPYELEDSGQFSISVPLPSSTTLAPGGSLTLGVRIDIRDIVKDLNFDNARLEAGKLIIDDETPSVLAAARAALVKAIHFDEN